MVILFLTNCLEPGKDGVGDYARLLAAECIRRGQDCYVMSLNDPYVSQPAESKEFIEDIPIVTLRFPASLSWEKRVELAMDFRTQRPVDWISLQFVSYGFNRKGIVKNLTRHLESFVAGYPVHIMFHEIWIGVGKSPSWKNRIMGLIQRHYIGDLYRRLKPRLATTSNPFYLSLLTNIGIDAVEMPLFGNIPISPAGTDLLLPKALLQAGLCDERGLHPDRYLGLFFGALYPEWKEEPFMSILASVPEKTGKRACLVSAGRMGSSGEAKWQKLQKAYSSVIDFFTVGECPTDQISALMQVADFGLATTPWHLLGKSGSVAAMLDHGLPVIVTNYDFQPPVVSSRPDDPLLHRCDATLEAKLWAGLPRRAPQHRSGDVAESLIGKLTKLTR